MEGKIILGVDPGFGRMGFGVIYVEGMKVELVDYGVITTTASLEVFFDKSDHAALINQMGNATAAVSCELIFNTTPESWTGNALVNSINVTAAAGDVVKATIELQFTGAVTL